MAFRVSVREAAAKTMSSTLSPAASEEAASEEAAVEEAVLEAAPPQAVRAAAAPTAPTTDRKLRREMRLVFMNFLLLWWLKFPHICSRPETGAGQQCYLRAHSPSRPAAMRTPCPRLGRMYSRFSFTAFGLPGRLTMSVLPRNTLAARLSIPRGVMERL